MRSPVRIALGAALVFFSAFALGCARSAEERQLEEMRDTIEQVQADRDNSDAKALDTEAAAPGEVRIGPPGQEPAPGAPGGSLSSTRLSSYGDDLPLDDSFDTAEADDAADPSPRPTIRVLGTPRTFGRGSRGEDQVEQSSMEDYGATPATPRSSALDPEAKRAYDSAMGLVNAKKYDAALDALAAFLVKWPDHPYADNAMYWRGECYFARGQYAPAAEQFEGVLARFPTGNKAPDAMLKLGMSQVKLGDPAKAKDLFDRLAQQFPKSDAAKHIPAVTAASAKPGPPPEDHR
jgi:tol-pal system protein YbgF